MRDNLLASRLASLSAGVLVAALTVFAVAPGASAQPCEVVDNGSGTVELPPPGCEYLTPNEVHMIIDGLPPGTEIILDPIHSQFFNVNEAPGGTLGGSVETFDSILQIQMTGTGELAGFARTIAVQVGCEVHTGPRTLGAAIQDFDTEMFQLQGQIFGDPDFDVLQIEAGGNLGLPSPGHTTLTRLGPPGSSFNVDSFFDVEYRISFAGAPGSILEGYSGTTESGVTPGADSVPMQTGEPAQVFDHMECFKIKDPNKVKGLLDLTPVQNPPFPAETDCKFVKAKKFCIPVTVAVTESNIPANPIAGPEVPGDFICYKAKCKENKNLLKNLTQPVLDLFGTRTLEKFKTQEVCVPAQKQ